MYIPSNRTATNISRCRPKNFGYSSQRAVIIASKPPNVLSRPSVINIKKNIIDQNTDPVIVAIASGYTMNTKPGPKNRKRYISKSWKCIRSWSYLQVQPFRYFSAEHAPCNPKQKK